jgi:hypothetical protein
MEVHCQEISKTMKFPVAFSLIFTAFYLGFFLPVSLNTQASFYDTQSAIESARALFNADPYSYQFHTWRPVGQVLYFTLAAGVFGEKNLLLFSHVSSLFWVLLGLAGSLRLCFLWLGKQYLPLVAFLLLSSKLILHYGPSGIIDLYHFALIPCAILFLEDPRAPKSSFLRFAGFLFCMFFAASTRMTIFGLAFLFLLLKKNPRSTRLKQLTALIFTVIGLLLLHLTVLFLLRGREYGWLTFKNFYQGMVFSHLDKVPHLSFFPAIELFFNAYGIVFLPLALAGLFYMFLKKEIFSPYFTSAFLWTLAHNFLFPNDKARYFLAILPFIILAIPYFLRQLPPLQKRFALCLLLFQAGSFLTTELPYHREESLKNSLARHLFTTVSKWKKPGIRMRLFWMGQLYNTQTATFPDLPHERSYNIYSLGPASFNLFADPPLKFFHPEKNIDWFCLKSWRKGFISPEMKNEALDGDIFIVSPALKIYSSQELPPSPRTLGDIEDIFPSRETPRWQLPLLLFRLRRQFLIQGIDGPPRPFASQEIVQGKRREIIWIDRLELCTREGKFLLKSESP